MTSPVVPPKLRPGDTLRVVAPARSCLLVAEHDLKGPTTRPCLTGHDGHGQASRMWLSLLYRVLHRVFEAVGVHRMDAVAKDAEALVLRHQLAVLRRQVTRPRFTWADRALVALLAGLVPKERWAAFLVTPKTILAWHRPLVRRHCTY